MMAARKLKASFLLANLAVAITISPSSFPDDFAASDLSQAWLSCNKEATNLAEIHESIINCSIILLSDLQSHEKRATALYKRGQNYSRQRDYAHAILDYTESINQQRDNALAFRLRGDAYGETEDYAHALEDFENAVRLEPNNADGYDSRASIYKKKGDYTRALTEYDMAISLDPGNPLFIDNRAWLYLNDLSDCDAALADFKQEFSLRAPNPLKILTGRVRFLRASERYDNKKDFGKGISCVNDSILLDTNHKFPEGLIVRGLKYQASGDACQAMRDYDEAIQQDPKSAPSYYIRGRLLLSDGATKRAIDDFDRAITLRPDYREATQWRNIATGLIGPGTDAEKSARHATDQKHGCLPTLRSGKLVTIGENSLTIESGGSITSYILSSESQICIRGDRVVGKTPLLALAGSEVTVSIDASAESDFANKPLIRRVDGGLVALSEIGRQGETLYTPMYPACDYRTDLDNTTLASGSSSTEKAPSVSGKSKAVESYSSAIKTEILSIETVPAFSVDDPGSGGTWGASGPVMDKSLIDAPAGQANLLVRINVTNLGAPIRWQKQEFQLVDEKGRRFPSVWWQHPLGGELAELSNTFNIASGTTNLDLVFYVPKHEWGRMTLFVHGTSAGPIGKPSTPSPKVTK